MNIQTGKHKFCLWKKHFYRFNIFWQYSTHFSFSSNQWPPACTIRAKIVHVIFLCNVVSDAFRQHRLDEIPMQCWEPLLQHCTGFLPMQYFPKSIKTTLNRIFLEQSCLEPQRQLYIRFFLGNSVPEDDSSGKYCTE